MKSFGEVTGIVIATPFYEVKAYSPYISSLVNSINALYALKMPFTYFEISGDSYVDRAKNSLVHKFLKDEKYSHIFMIDSDEAWDVEGFLRVIKAAMLGAEIVGGAYPCKNNWEFFGCMPKKSEDGHYIGKEFEDIRLLNMEGIPGGFILYSRKSFERARPNLNSYIAPEINESILECFRCNVEKSGGRIGEDIYFQTRYKEVGGTVWCEPNVTIQHFGVKGWEGNYQDHLLKRKSQIEAENSLGMSESETDKILKAIKKTNQEFAAKVN